MNCSLLPLAIVVTGITLATSARADIGLSFYGRVTPNGTAIPAATAQGVIARPNWNNTAQNLATGATANITDPVATKLVDHTGAQTTTTVSWVSDATYNVGPAVNPANPLFDGYIDDTTAAGFSTISFAAIPYALYDVYVYYGSDGNGRSIQVQLNNDALTARYGLTNVNPFGGFVEATATSLAAAANGNYFKYTGLSNPACLVQFNRQSNNSGIMGVQIVATAAVPGVATLVNTAVSNLTSTAARVSGQVTNIGSATPTVTLYWGDNDAGANTVGWDNSVSLGLQAGTFFNDLTGLTPSTLYYFRYAATNASGTGWAPSTATFTTPFGIPTVVNGAVTNLLAQSATLAAQVTATGGQAPTVVIYYGTTDGGTTIGNWTSSLPLGTLAGTGSGSVSGLTMGVTYYFRALATNTAGSSWAASTATFTTPIATLPSVVNSPATDVSGFAATLRGTVTGIGNDPPVIKIYYGASDGGTIPGSWANNVSLPVQSADFAKLVGGLLGNTNYFYRAWAQNAAGAVWAPSSSSFTTTSFTPASLVINEIHYHPVEREAFNVDGTPVLDLTEDVHEFVEIYNATAAPIVLDGYTLSGGISYTFPASTSIPAAGYKVIARNPARMALVYAGLTGVLGPYTGTLGNGSDTVRLRDPLTNTVDQVNYASTFPWANGADALGVAEDFTLLNPASYQYRGRSLERVSVNGNANDPANWLASPLGSAPTPGAANAFTQAMPSPVAVSFSAAQASDDAAIIRAAASVRINFTLANTTGLFNPQIEYFVDNINSFSEVHSFLPLTSLGNGLFTAVLPGQVDRSVVRYRFLGNLGSGEVQIVPRLDDARIVPVSFTGRESWCSYFVSPVRTSLNPIYDLLLSNDGSPVANGAPNNYPFNGLNGFQTMAYNASGNPKRATLASSAGVPRDIPYVPATDRLWNGSVPAIFIENGTVRDVHFRLHGSRYNRNPTRATYKLRFPDTQKYQAADSQFITDKSDYFSVMHGMYENANLPISHVRWIDWYLNGDAKVVKLEQGEYNGDLLDKYHAAQADLNPGTPKETSGEFYKNVGIIPGAGEEGPYGTGDGRRMVAGGLWTAVQKYQWTYLIQSNGWKGATNLKNFIEGMWTARGDTELAPAPNVPALRAYLDTVMDVDTELTSMALLNWSCPWDDTSQNHFFWQRANGKWAHFPWDFDGMFGNGDTTGANSWIYLGEVGAPAPNTNIYGAILGNNFRGPNFFKDSFLKAYRTEYNNRLWLLNNTYLHPDNLKTLFFTNGAGGQQSYYSYINAVKAGFCEGRWNSVNVQLGHAADGSDFLRPAKPVHTSPLTGATALPPGTLVASAYTHSSGNTAGGNAHAKSKWEIRSSTGNYLTPVVVTTSTTSLTTLPIPFDKLTFGQSYFWRVTYLDASEHPSLTSTETLFVYGPQSSAQTIITWGDAWKYDKTIAFTDNSWAQPAYNDSAWATGNGVFYQTGEPIVAPGVAGTVVPAPATNTPVGRAYLFRRHFNFPSNPLTATIRIRHYVDDGCVIWINGQKVHRYYFNEQPNYTTAEFTSAAAGPGEAVYQYADAVTNTTNFAYIDPRPFMVQGDNVIAIQVHQTGTGSSDIVMGLEMTATLPALAGDVVINEVMADNGSAVANGGKFPDYIELKNNTGAAVNIGGNGLTDDILNPNRYVFPVGTTIPANGYLTIWCDDDVLAPGLHTGFGISSNGQRVVLTNAGALRDYIAFGPQARNLTIGRIPNGTGAFALTTATANAANVAVSTMGVASNLRVNEWMASPAHGEDWFELYNADPNPVALAGLFLSDTPATPLITQLPPLSFIAGGGFADFVADGTNNGNNRCNFKLSGGGDRILITNATGNTTLQSTVFGAQANNISQGRFPDGGAAIVSFPTTGSKGESNWLRHAAVTVNEALTNSTPPLQDFIELRNNTASAVDVSGWWLSDDRSLRQKYALIGGSIIPANGFLTIYESSFNAGANPFSLSSTGDEIILSATSGGLETGYRDQVNFGAAADDVSFGTVVTSALPEFWAQTARTPNATNAPPKLNPVIINEVNYHPLDLVGSIDNARDEFVELHNPTTQVVNISGWRLKSAVDFTFAPGTLLQPGDYVLVVGFNPLTDPVSLTAFKTALSVPTTTVIYGPFTPALNNNDASVELAFPGTLVGLTVPLVLQDKVKYLDVSPWTTTPDGTGASLQRVSRVIIGNDPSNWIGTTPTPGQVNFSQTPILDNDGDGISNEWELANGLNPFNAADALTDDDGDGQSNANEFLAQTNPHNASDVLTALCTLGATTNTITFTAKANVSYSVFVSTDLNPNSWTKLTDIPAGTERPISLNDPATPNRRFYKLTTPQAP